jgi:2,4-dienoyl-CoA reductase-like NADH-dependent reductase (Old Yellow Enzyme family)
MTKDVDMEFSKYNFKSKNEMEDFCVRSNISLRFSENTDVLKKTVTIGKVNVKNSLGIHPMEGCDGSTEGIPGELTRRRYERFASGGAGLIWFEATAVDVKGKANPRQLFISNENIGSFSSIREDIEKNSAGGSPVVIMQLTHSGRFSKPSGKPEPILECKNDILDRHQRLQILNVISDDELEKLEDDFAASAKLAYKAGFDGVDMKACHRYLNSGLLAAFTREGKYGGDFKGRTRFICNCVDKIREQVSDPSFIIGTRMNIFDSIPYPYGFGVDKMNYMVPDFKEPIELAKILYKKGVKIINVTMGTPYYNPHVNRPFDTGEYKPIEHPLEGVARLINGAAQIKKGIPEMIIMGTGYTWLRDYAPYAAAYAKENGMADIIGFGRQALSYPDCINDILDKGGMDPKKCCITCGKCVELMRSGSTPGCVIRDREVYMPLYTKLSE